MYKKKFGVLVVGELNIDLILNQLDQFPQIGKEIIAQKMAFTLGSSAAIFACNLSALGTKVSFLGKVGKDFFAGKILSDLKGKGVETSLVSYSNTADTGITVAFNFDEERAMVTYPGAMHELTEEDISDEVLQSADHLHVSSIFLQPGLKPGLVQLFHRAKQNGLTTSLDPQWDPTEKWDCEWRNLLPYVDLFMPNLDEIKNISGHNDIDLCINSLKEYASVLVVKNGHEGALIWDGNKILKQPAFINREIADAIGAGDSFNAGFIHRFIRDHPLEECAAFGALCGAINTTCSGGTTAFTNKENIKQIARQKFNYHLNDL